MSSITLRICALICCVLLTALTAETVFASVPWKNKDRKDKTVSVIGISICSVMVIVILVLVILGFCGVA